LPLAKRFPARPNGLDAAIAQQMPRLFASLTNNGHPAWLGYEVVGILYLGENGDPLALVQVHKLWRAAARACGPRVASASWAVLFYFGGCHIPCSHGAAFFVRTARGWKAWS
jgi:hypothetical protein